MKKPKALKLLAFLIPTLVIAYAIHSKRSKK